jgi:hypothetical protein
MTEKTVNYTDEMVAQLQATYDPSADEATRKAQISELAVKLDRKEASIRAKLTREGVYVPNAKAPAKERSATKAELVSRIAVLMGADEDVIGSLEKATKVTLNKVLEALS